MYIPHFILFFEFPPMKAINLMSCKVPPSLILLWVVFTLSACTTAPLDTAERKWQNQGITSYTIEVLAVNSIWHAQYQQITVEEGVVTAQSGRCVPAPLEMGECEVQDFVAEDFTVPGLFAKARAVSETADPDFLTVSFAPIYFYPENISFNDPEIVDEDWGWSVTSFEVLK